MKSIAVAEQAILAKLVWTLGNYRVLDGTPVYCYEVEGGDHMFQRFYLPLGGVVWLNV